MSIPDHLTFKHAKIKCPKCGHIMDHSTVIDSNEPRQPEKGDITMCIGCGEFWQFDKKLKLEKVDETSLDEETLKIIIKAKLTYNFIKSHH